LDKENAEKSDRICGDIKYMQIFAYAAYAA